ncbi:MAG: tetratricopeptide (TPR) repeat protein [Pseudohongiellaceae bacterium]|jgi:tetratricopeptide (TPR) repeat protein
MIAALLTLGLALPVVAFAGAFADDLDTALVAVNEGRFAEAEQLLEQLLAGAPKDERPIRLAQARLFVDTSRGQLAMDALAPLTLTGDSEATKLTGLAFAALGDEIEFADGPIEDADYYYGEALQHLERAADLATRGDTDAAVEAAYLALYIFSDWSKAESLADTALRRTKHDGEALLARGCARVRGFAAMDQHMTPSLRTANWDAAEADLLEAVKELGPDRTEPWWQLIWLYEQGERPDDALAAALSHHDATGREDSSTILRLALSFARGQQLAPSLAAIQALIDRDQDGLIANLRSSEDLTGDTVALSWAVQPLLSKRRQGEARDLLQVLGLADPADADFWNNLAFLCRETGKYEQSYVAYEKAVSLDDTSPRLLNDTALILQYHLHRNLDRARFLYERAVTLAEAALDEKPSTDIARELRSARTDARNNLSRLGSSRR